MTATFIVRGTPLPVLTALTSSQSTRAEPVRALVWGVDLTSATSRRAAQKHLRTECRQVAESAAALPALAHLFIVYIHDATLPEGSGLTSAAQIAAKLHAELERTRGRFVEVIFIDATGWDDGETLRERIVETVAQPAGVAGDIALGWRAICDTSIHKAAMAQLC